MHEHDPLHVPEFGGEGERVTVTYQNVVEVVHCWNCGRFVRSTNDYYKCKSCNVMHAAYRTPLPMFTTPGLKFGEHGMTYVDHATQWAPTP